MFYSMLLFGACLVVVGFLLLSRELREWFFQRSHKYYCAKCRRELLEKELAKLEAEDHFGLTISPREP